MDTGVKHEPYIDGGSDIDDSGRYPTLSEAGRMMLQRLLGHPHAPIFRNRSGNRLLPEDVEAVRAFEAEARHAVVGWRPGRPPGFLRAFVERCFANVPHYRAYGPVPPSLLDVPTISRADLGRDIAAFVPDDLPLERVINFRTSGTTGHPLLLASHPVVAASYAAFHRRALRRHGVELSYGQGQVGVVLVGFQTRCFTYVSVNPTFGESGLVKLNLHPDDWRDPDDRARYLDALAPELYTGDPISLSALSEVPLVTSPRAMLSTSMALSPALRRRLEARFSCPVIDIYSLNEAGPVAFACPRGEGHELLQHRMYVEILDRQGHALPEGERGEVVLTGGFNPYLPLLRYRTGDHASLAFDGGLPRLVGLQGRPPVRYRTMDGELLNNIELTHALGRFALVQYTLHQSASGALLLTYAGPMADERGIGAAVLDLFGPGQELRVERVGAFEGKVVQYTSELGGAEP